MATEVGHSGAATLRPILICSIRPLVTVYRDLQGVAIILLLALAIFRTGGFHEVGQT